MVTCSSGDGEEGGERRDSGTDLTDRAMILESRIRASAPGLRNLWNRSSLGEAGEDLGSLRAISEREMKRDGERWSEAGKEGGN